jgi:HD-GYP domain-containing protein (c-di-GMP phosphodiesterase class II)
MAMMAAGSGTQFDPDLFARFERVISASDVVRPLPEPQRAAS